eukprot:scaffold13797_cov102-Isochrysis_galbana.AAC.4
MPNGSRRAEKRRQSGSATHGATGRLPQAGRRPSQAGAHHAQAVGSARSRLVAPAQSTCRKPRRPRPSRAKRTWLGDARVACSWVGPWSRRRALRPCQVFTKEIQQLHPARACSRV